MADVTLVQATDEELLALDELIDLRFEGEEDAWGSGRDDWEADEEDEDEEEDDDWEDDDWDDDEDEEDEEEWEDGDDWEADEE